MKLVCDCGNEEKVLENGTIDGVIIEGYLSGDAFEMECVSMNGASNNVCVKYTCKKCGKSIFF